jgi:ubiquinone/menaquinone biosynthesis C-methylase UbiE
MTPAKEAAMDDMPREPEPELMDDAAEAAAYARADFSDVNQAFADRLIGLAGDLCEASAVDLGAGPGDIAIRVVRARPSWHVTAVDASAAMLALARKAVERAGLGRSITVLHAYATATDFPPRSFDVVFSNSILHHVASADGLWAEVKRLARPGARVLMRDLARPQSRRAARDIVRRYAGTESALLQQEYYRSLLSSYTPDEIRGQLDRAGLHMLDVAMASDRHVDVFGRL